MQAGHNQALILLVPSSISHRNVQELSYRTQQKTSYGQLLWAAQTLLQAFQCTVYNSGTNYVFTKRLKRKLVSVSVATLFCFSFGGNDRLISVTTLEWPWDLSNP